MEWASFFIAPLAAAIQVGVGYALVKPACASGGPAMLLMLSAATFVAAGIGAVMGWSRRDRFIGQVSGGLNVIVMILAIASTIPHFVLSPCE
jgi:predicted lysophospholipase L1 biosynthesis ABC-type transport system permease subunit